MRKMNQPAVQQEQNRAASPRHLPLGDALPEFNTPGGRAYALVDDELHYAFVHEKRVPLRADVLKVIPRLRKSSLQPLIEQRLLPMSDGERLVSIFERPTGPSLAALANGKGLPERVIREVILPPLVATLSELHSLGVAHRGLSPERIYFDADMKTVMIGECFSAPPAQSQSPLFETVERAMAHAVGRGDGGPADDYYALGATVVAVTLGRDLAQGRTAEQVLAAKMSNGSFWSLCSGAPLVGSIATLARGLLHDNIAERWAAEDVTNWITSSGKPVVGSVNEWKLLRQVIFAGKTFTDRRLLAAAMARDIATSAAFIRELDMEEWIAIHLSGVEATPELVSLIATGQGTRQRGAPSQSQERLVTRFLALLDPAGPIRYRGLALMADGLGPALAAAQNATQDARDIMNELITSPLLRSLTDIYASLHAGPNRDRLLRVSSHLNKLIRRRGLSDALERAIYALNPGLACQSSIFAAYWVKDLQSAVTIVNNLAESGGERLNLADTHLTGFLAAHDSVIAEQLGERPIPRGDQQAAANALLTTFGSLQKRLNLAPMPALAMYFKKRLAPALRRLRHQGRRALAEKHLAEMSDHGDLADMARIFDIDRLLEADAHAFARARGEVRLIDRRLAQLSGPVSPKDPAAVLSGARIASSLATIVLLLSILARLL